MPDNTLENSWIEENFGNCDLNDSRLSKRLVKIAKSMSLNPEGIYTPTNGILA